MDPKNWNFEVDQDEEDGLPLETKFGRDWTIFVIDCSEPMFLVKTEDGLTHFELSLQVAKNLYCLKCTTSDRDYLGILFYNTEKMKNSHSFEHVYIFHEMGSPGAEKVKEIEFLLKGDVRKNFKQNYGHADCKLDEVFWMCGTMFSNAGVSEGSRRIFLFTNCDYPHKNDPDQQRRVIQKIQDLKEQQVNIELLPVGREDFCWDNFYAQALLEDGDVASRPNPADRIDELMDRTLRKHQRKRALTTIPFELAPGLELAVGVFNMIASAKIPTAVKLERKTNQEIKTARTFMDVETGEKLLPVDLKKFQTYGSTKISMEPDEVDRMKRLCEPGLVLLGFKKKSTVKSIYHIRPCLFLYPNESAIKGGSQLFRCLLERCLAKDTVAICRLTARRNMAPRLVALLPQAESFDVKGSQDEPPGFQCVFLPYSDDIRDLSKVEDVDRPQANSDQVKKAKEIIDKLTIKDYNPETITNPALQKHFKAIEAFALDREEVEEITDHSKPNFDRITRKAGQLIQEFKDLVYPDDYTPGGVKKRAAAAGGAAKKPKLETNEISLEDEAKAGRLEKLTVAQLRELSAANRIKLLVTRKADIITQLNKHYGV